MFMDIARTSKSYEASLDRVLKFAKVIQVFGSHDVRFETMAQSGQNHLLVTFVFFVMPSLFMSKDFLRICQAAKARAPLASM